MCRIAGSHFRPNLANRVNDGIYTFELDYVSTISRHHLSTSGGKARFFNLEDIDPKISKFLLDVVRV